MYTYRHVYRAPFRILESTRLAGEYNASYGEFCMRVPCSALIYCKQKLNLNARQLLKPCVFGPIKCGLLDSL